MKQFFRPVFGWWIIPIGLLLVMGAFKISSRDTGWEQSHRNIALRNIGHQILLKAGDFQSRVLPVETLAENDYLIRLQHPFAFEPDSLVKIVRGALANSGLPNNYTVSVIQDGGQEIVFGYTISSEAQKTIIPCSGRKMDKKHYSIRIQFQPAELISNNMLIAMMLAPLFLLALYSAFRYYRKPKREPVPEEAIPGSIHLGQTLFDSVNRQLSYGEQVTALTVTENKILLLFASAPNLLMERNQLQKTIWEDEGVIVGRSLDVFISKLRKKMEPDTSIRIANIHGRGYKLEVGSG